jgi:hypothetical protein
MASLTGWQPGDGSFDVDHRSPNPSARGNVGAGFDFTGRCPLWRCSLIKPLDVVPSLGGPVDPDALRRRRASTSSPSRRPPARQAVLAESADWLAPSRRRSSKHNNRWLARDRPILAGWGRTWDANAAPAHLGRERRSAFRHGGVPGASSKIGGPLAGSARLSGLGALMAVIISQSCIAPPLQLA